MIADYRSSSCEVVVNLTIACGIIKHPVSQRLSSREKRSLIFALQARLKRSALISASSASIRDRVNRVSCQPSHFSASINSRESFAGRSEESRELERKRSATTSFPVICEVPIKGKKSNPSAKFPSNCLRCYSDAKVNSYEEKLTDKRFDNKIRYVEEINLPIFVIMSRLAIIKILRHARTYGRYIIWPSPMSLRILVEKTAVIRVHHRHVASRRPTSAAGFWRTDIRAPGAGVSPTE